MAKTKINRSNRLERKWVKERKGNNEFEEAHGEVNEDSFGNTDGKHAILGEKQDK